MAKNNKLNNSLPNYRVNKEIYVEGSPMVRLVKEDGTNEVCHISQARDMAKEAELDLIEINGKVTPPILKIVDYSKFLYEIKQKMKKQQHSSKPMKEVQLSVSIASNDMATKAKNARKFILEGSKVKVVLTFRGREKARKEENKKSLYEFLTMLEDVATPESLPKDEGDNKTIVILKAKASVKKS